MYVIIGYWLSVIGKSPPARSRQLILVSLDLCTGLRFGNVLAAAQRTRFAALVRGRIASSR
jgi:hypothetical protein